MESDTHPAETFPMKAQVVAPNLRTSGSVGMKPLATCPPRARPERNPLDQRSLISTAWDLKPKPSLSCDVRISGTSPMHPGARMGHQYTGFVLQAENPASPCLHHRSCLWASGVTMPARHTSSVHRGKPIQPSPGASALLSLL